MANSFSDIPDVVVDYVRKVFSDANDKVARAIGAHPSLYEATLDHILIMELTAAPPAFFATEKIGLSLESHWLGGRWMFERWEIADIAIFIILRQNGHLIARKVALLQTKRLYSKEIDVAEIEEADYRIGIGRLADKTDPTLPLSRQRAFSFDVDCVYGAMPAARGQIGRIAEYMETRGVPVYYGLYNPPCLPFAALYPPSDGVVKIEDNPIGFRVMPAQQVHKTLQGLPAGMPPSYGVLKADSLLDQFDRQSVHGWRLEKFVADEVLRCRQGRIFDDPQDPNLRSLLYERSAPISAAITINIDLGGPD